MNISQAELDVMKVLWRSPGIAAADVYDALADKKTWNIRTVKTLLARLVEKEALTTKAEGRRYLYTPLISRDDYQSQATKQFVDRHFSGRAAPLVAHLADSRGLTAEDIDELEKLLGELKND